AQACWIDSNSALNAVSSAAAARMENTASTAIEAIRNRGNFISGPLSGLGDGRRLAGVTADHGQLLAECAIDDAWQEAVHSGEQLLGPAEHGLHLAAGQHVADRLCDELRRIHRHAELGVHALDGRSIDAGA